MNPTTQVSIHCHGEFRDVSKRRAVWGVEVTLVATGVKTIIIGVYVFYDEGGDYTNVGYSTIA